MKRLAELKSKLNSQRYHIMLKTLPEYEGLCLNWFNNVKEGTSSKKERRTEKKIESEDR